MKYTSLCLFLSPYVATAQFQTFQTAGELRAAVDQYMNNGKEEAMAKYGDISVWNVSLVDDMTGKLLAVIYFPFENRYSTS